MYLFLKYRLIALLLLFVGTIQAQQSTDSTALYFNLAVDEDEWISDSTVYSKELDGFQHYRPELEMGTFFQRQSNIGHALRLLDFTPEQFADQLDEDLFHSSPYHPYMLNKSSIRYYTSLKPITDLYYVMGQGNEQYFKVVHAQPVTDQFYFSLEHRVLNSPGDYHHHLANHGSPVFHLRYQSENKKYHALGTYFHNKLEVDDNGGILSNTYFTDSATFNDRILIPVNLPDANILIKGGGFHFRQSFYPEADSMTTGDSTGYGFYHDLYYEKEGRVYTDGGNMSGFYPDSMNIGSVHDSVSAKRLVNKLGVKFRYRSAGFDLSLAHKYHNTWVNGQDSVMNKLTPAGDLRFDTKDWEFHLAAKAGFVNNQQEVRLGADVRKSFPSFELAFKGGYLNALPAVMLNRYQSTYYEWSNGFKNSKLSYIGALLSHKYGKLNVNLYDVDDYIYFNEMMKPVQLEKAFRLLQVRFAPSVSWNGLTFKNVFQYQKTVGDQVMRLPQYMSQHELFYSFNLIEDVLKTQVGAQLRYHASFKGHQYIPATQTFALNDAQAIGNYPYLDVFANFYIKRTRIFVRYSHLNALLEDHRYFLMPSYPMRDEAFQFGLSWMFYD
ncbi:MAG: putative porin [Bacteroidales bacterium]